MSTNPAHLARKTVETPPPLRNDRESTFDLFSMALSPVKGVMDDVAMDIGVYAIS
jgi:hypothetical protein